jgi:hypothetical protein
MRTSEIAPTTMIAAVVVGTTASQERGYVDRVVLEFMRGKRVS